MFIATVILNLIMTMTIKMEISQAIKAGVTLVKVSFTTGVNADQLPACRLFYDNSNVMLSLHIFLHGGLIVIHDMDGGVDHYVDGDGVDGDLAKMM